MKLNENIKIKRQELNLTLEEVAKKMGTSRQTIQRYESGVISNIPSDKIELLSKALGTTPAKLMGWETPDGETKSKKKGVTIPVIGRVVAGVPLDAIEEIIGYAEITPEMAQRGKHFGLIIEGDSMFPKIENGDTVVVREQPDVESGEIAIVLVNGHEATCKKFVKHENGISLIGLNSSAYSPRFYTAEEVNGLPIQIIGKVVQLLRDF